MGGSNKLFNREEFRKMVNGGSYGLNDGLTSAPPDTYQQQEYPAYPSREIIPITQSQTIWATTFAYQPGTNLANLMVPPGVPTRPSAPSLAAPEPQKRSIILEDEPETS